MKDHAAVLLSETRHQGAEEVSVTLDFEKSALARFSRNQIIENGEFEQISVRLAVAVDSREAVLQSNICNPAELHGLAKRAVETARLFPVNPEHSGPVDPMEFPAVSCFDSRTAEMSPSVKADIIRKVCDDADKRNLTVFGTFTNSSVSTVIANSNGLLAEHEESNVEFTLTVRTNDGTGSCREARSHNRIDAIPIDELAAQTMEWAEQSRNPQSIDPGDYTVILTPTAAINYLPIAFWCFDARMVDEKRSALVHHFGEDNPVGKQLFSPSLTVFSRTNHPDHPTRPFGQAFSMEGMSGQGAAMTQFSMGLPTEEFPLIENGVLKNLFHSLSYARKLNRKPVAFPNMIEWNGGDQSLDELIASVDYGLLINSFWYIRFVDGNNMLLTGLTRDGLFLIENGKIASPVKNLRFNESPLVSLGNIMALGKPERRQTWNNVVLIPPMKVANFSFTSPTDAI